MPGSKGAEEAGGVEGLAGVGKEFGGEGVLGDIAGQIVDNDARRTSNDVNPAPRGDLLPALRK
jgi:hypothetical protein